MCFLMSLGANMTSQRQEGFGARKFYTIWDNGMYVSQQIIPISTN